MVDNPEDKDVTELTPLNIEMAGMILQDDEERNIGFGASIMLHPIPSRQCVEMVLQHVHTLIMADIKNICTLIAQHEIAVPGSEKMQ